MLELASVGAKVLQTRSVGLAMKENVRVQVLSSFTGDDAPMADTLPGTMIVGEEEIDEMERQLITGIAHDKNEAKITLTNVSDTPGSVAAIFAPLAAANINVDMIIQNIAHQSAGRAGSTDVTFTVPAVDLARVDPGARTTRKDAIGFEELVHDTRVAKISVVGVGMKSHAGVASDDVHDAGPARHQHPGDLDQRDQGQRADPRGRDRTRGARAAHGLWAGRGGSGLGF